MGKEVYRSVFVLLASSVVFLGGCTVAEQQPTHRWASNDGVADEVRYHNDHARCQSQAGLNDARRMETDSPAFAKYQQCMNQQGYELTAYAK